ncbi:GGDEF domain-containing protein [Sinorhizobium alkalisoli]|uniref:diguanylate cyclase n=1 Tax=Sinorhizobium alkalisoli TaxID=1752398 RepID=A0A1E3VEM5_9HYPH|nr:GGDEF domain-containing protein [Sinorhizobium alkalisoli]MCA1493538.1 GGDEF domain-containing protein [Ensifer sp. NBAIM29]MCG5478755.1 GGDEF domain-containing protein [Sinorhizobium alkalisoli]ODR91336.1 diguanylate cyclase [Sinorhizobium alkalisoli]QFI66572.1 diguanylate cyclase (GGDEF domain) with PAS/PAC sensor [Sinorhizobium alkalisoli]
MHTATSNRTPTPDIAAQISHAMRMMGVAPIPRNYELYYEAYLGSDPQLSKELAALGSRATQEELDAIGARHFSHIHHSRGIERAHSTMVAKLSELLNLLKDEQYALESYNKVLDEAYLNMTNKSAASVDILRHAIGILSEATADTMNQGKERVQSVVQKSVEMEAIRQELDEYKRIANTDSLTRLANRRAFDENLAAIYNSEHLRNFTGLLLADIDHFKKINDSFGHPVGDKILATVANVIRANLRREAFVARTGGEEFAIILRDSTQEECLQAADRIRTVLSSAPFKNTKTGVSYGAVTLSVGVCMATAADDPVELYNKADIALYAAKNAGRNRTVLFEEGMRKDAGRNWLIYRR